MKLTDKQETFAVARVVEGLDASAAYRKAYDASRMKPETINRKAHDVEHNGKITARMAELQAEVNAFAAARFEATVERVVAEYSRIAFTNLGDVAQWGPGGLALRESSELTPEAAAAVKEIRAVHTRTEGAEDGSSERVEYRVQMHDKKGALDSLARYLGMFVERHEHSGPNGGPIPLLAGLANLTERQLALIIQGAKEATE